MPNVGPMEIVLLLGLALLLFGAKRLPEIGRSVGHGMREFKDSISGNTPTHLELDGIETSSEVAQAEVAHTTDADVPVVVVVRDHDTV